MYGSQVGVEESLKQNGYHMITVHMDRETMRHDKGLSMIRERRVDGLILAGPEFENRYILQLVGSGIPIVLLDNMLEETPVNCVLSDNVRGAYQITKHLLTAHQHKHTVFLSGPTQWLSSRERYAGYCRAVAEAGLEPHRVTMPDTTIDTGQEAMQQVLAARPDVTAVVAVNDATAWGAGRACKEAGLSVPGDVALVGYDDVAFARLHEPPLTTVRMHVEDLGVCVARRLIELIEDGPSPPMCVRITPELVVRGSCGTH